MSLSKLERRGQRIQGLLSSFPNKASKLKGPLFLVDSSFKRAEINDCSKIEKKLFKETVSQLIQKERQEAMNDQKAKQSAHTHEISLKLSRYVLNKEQTQAMNLKSTPSLKKETSNYEPFTKKVYLERKYNSKLSYHFYKIIQAKKIEDSKQRTRNQLNSASESPLIRNTIKITRTQRKTGCFGSKQMTSNNFIRSGGTERENTAFDRTTCRNLMRNQKIREAFEVKERDQMPVTLSSESQLKRYCSSIYLSSVKPVSKHFADKCM